MQEDFLHYIWKYQKFKSLDLKTFQNETIVVSSVGQHNLNSGPDLFNAKVSIGGQLWAGNLEVHIKSSDWYVHGHETDINYDNVILHVVWEHDTDIYRKDNSTIPTLQLKEIVDDSVLKSYQKLMANKDKFINCQNDFPKVDDFVLNHWIDRLFIERLERKSNLIFKLLEESNNDWEAVLFKMLAKNFGLKVNGDSFFSMAQSFDYYVLRKIQSNQLQIEALFFGQLQMLQVDEEVPYQKELSREYEFLQNKFKLDNSYTTPVKYFRLRPPNFPTIRLSQLAMLYAQSSNLFSQIESLQKISELRELFNVKTSTFWETHFSFGKESKFSEKRLSKSFIDLLIINTIIPIKFCHMKSLGITDFEKIMELAEELKAEKNSIVEGYKKLREIPDTALFSQGLLQLKSEYCDKNYCLSCEIGNRLLSR